MLDVLFTPRASGTANPSQWLIDWIRGGTETYTGMTINSETVYNTGAFYQAVSTISGDIGRLPLRIMRRARDGDTERDRAHPAHKLFFRRPSLEITPMVFVRLLTSWALTWGNGCAAIIRQGSVPVELVPLLPDRTQIKRGPDKQLWYVTRIDERGEDILIRPENVLHIQGLSSNGLWGRSVIDLARNDIGYEQALKKHGGKLFANGLFPSGVLERPVEARGEINPDARKELRREWKELYGGLDNAGKVAILQEGIKFRPLNISNVDAQWLQAVQASPEAIARWFLLPPHKLGVLKDSSVRANIEQQNRDYLDTTLSHWLVAWEQECNAKLMTQQQQATESHFFKFNVDALLRADTKTRYEVYQIGRTIGVLNSNEIRQKEDMNRREDEGGESYENPNTTSGPTEPEPPPQPQQNGTVAQSHRALLLDRARQLITIECQKVNRAARRGGNFLAWLDEFYDDQYRDLAVTYLDHAIACARAANLGPINTASIIAHSKESARELVELAGVVTVDNLADEVDRLVGTWPARADGLIGNLLSEVNCEAA